MTVENALTTGIPEVLFVCVHNAGRSQMAAALLAHPGRGRVTALGRLHPRRRDQPSRGRSAAQDRRAPGRRLPHTAHRRCRPTSDVIIMGCGDACPVYPGKRYLDWALHDPAGKTLEQVRPIRDDIDHLVHTLLAELIPAR